MTLIELQILTWPTWYAWIVFGFVAIIIFSVAALRIFLIIGLASIVTGIIISLKIFNNNYICLIFFFLMIVIFHYVFLAMKIKKK